jgi:transposase
MKELIVTDIREIIRCLRAGMPQRQVAKTVGVARNTVADYKRDAEALGWLDASKEAPSDLMIAQMLKTRAAPVPQTVSRLLEHVAWIKARRAAGVSVAKIHQELNGDLFKLSCAYSSVWEFVNQQEGPELDVTVRVETAPGEEAQVDFGFAGRMYDPLQERLRKAWVFVMTLSYSRHMFLEFVFDQTVETWLRCHRHAFEFFGGVPARVRLDNLKAAILHASQEDPIVQRAYREEAEYYGHLITPCRVATPQHKGKVEAGVKYVARNFLAGTNADYTRPDRHIAHANQDVRKWILEAAGRRTHATTGWQPHDQFEQVERAKLKPLPQTPYEVAFWTQVKLHRDCHFVLQGSYYSAPYRLVGQQLDLRISDREVQVFSAHERILTHSRLKQRGQRQTDLAHLPNYKLVGMMTAPVLREQAALIGPYTARVVAQLLDVKPIDKTSVVQRLIGLAGKHERGVLERACQQAVECGDATPQTIRNMIKLVTSGVSSAASPAEPQVAPLFARDISELAPAHALKPLSDQIIEPDWARPGLWPEVVA